MPKYYHITKKSNVPSIIGNGLKAKEDKVFLFDRTTVPYCEGFYRRDCFSKTMRNFEVEQVIAKNELMLNEYSLFEVETEGLDLHDDVCGEMMSDYQKYVNGDIPSDKVRYIGDYKVKPYWDFEKLDTRYEVPNGARVVKLQYGKLNLGFVLQRG